MSVRDANDQVINVGDLCIYNLSGELAQGTVTEIKDRWYNNGYGLKFTGYILIKNRKDDFISRVRNRKCIWCLDRMDGT